MTKNEGQTISIFSSNFFKDIEDKLISDPNIINWQDPEWDNKSYLCQLTSAGFYLHIAFLLNLGANIYLSDKDNDKNNPLYLAVGQASVNVDAGQKEKSDNYFKIFKILLNYEAEIRADNPEKYKEIKWLKEQDLSSGLTLYKSAHRNAEVGAKYDEAIKEAEEHYKECLEAKKNGRIITPYHKQFLPKLEEAEVQVELMSDSSKNRSWESKIDPTGLRKRNRTGSDEKEAEKNANEETKPLLKASDTKRSPKKETLGLFTSVLNYFSSSSGNKSTIVH